MSYDTTVSPLSQRGKIAYNEQFMKKKAVKQQEVLSRQVAEILPTKKGLEQVMAKKKIRLYLGIDPTGFRLHLGHTIPLRKIQQFADLGHEVILVVGTGTVLAGDPSQRDDARPKITQKDIEKNIKTWKQQAGKILDFTKVKIKQNGDWLLKLNIGDVLEIASHISAVQLFQRDMFKRRISKGNTVWMHETLYPLLQGYDSVAMDVDLEVGGTDQVFNMLIGRELQRKMSNREKFVLTVPMILGLDGKTMSKSSGNTVNITDSPKEMYGKIMTLRDELVPQYFELCTDISEKEIANLQKTLPPRDFKAYLAKEITATYHDSKKAEAAEKEFIQLFREKKQPTSMATISGLKKSFSLLDVVAKSKLVTSRSEARRVIEQGGVRIDGKVYKDPHMSFGWRAGMVIQVGKRKFAKVGK